MYDFHMHTNHSADSDAPMEAMIKQAVVKGFREICLTDHVDYMSNGDPFPYQINYDEYINEFNALRDKYAAEITVRLGAEIGLSPYINDKHAEFVSKYPFDYIIGSSHDVHRQDLYIGTFFQGKDKKTAYTQYFEEVLENVRTYDGFCVYGHIDYIRRYGGYEDNSLDYGDYRELIDEILAELIARGKGLELNTSGFRYGLNQTHPSITILRRYKELGGEIITLGSDAHNPRYIGGDFAAGRAALREAGFTAVTTFKDRKPVWHDLEA